MNIQIEFWQAVGLAATLLGAWIGGAKLFFTQVDRRLDERFSALERDRQSQSASFKATFESHARDETVRLDRIDAEAKERGERLARLEADVMHMPSHDDLRLIHVRLDALMPEVGRIKGIEHLLHGINDYLRENGK